MKISDLKIYPVRVPLIHEFKAAYGIRNTADFVLVKIESDEGIYGWGEASTIPIYDEGSQADVVYVIEKYFKPLLLGENPTNIGYLMQKLEHAVKGSRYAKCAVDFALHDLAGRIFGLPVYKMLGGTGEPLEVCWVLSAKSPEAVRSEAEEYLNKGYRHFKLKVGTDFQKDLENLKMLRNTVGDEVEIRLDGNEGWDPKEALYVIKEFEAYHPEHIEQPVPAWNYEGLKFVKDHVDSVIVADECILTPKDTMHIAKLNAADKINIKVSRDGGIILSRKIAAIAEAAGLQPFAGSNLELGLGTMASAHMFSALPELTMATELVGPLLLKEDVVCEPVIYENGRIVFRDLPGFGIEIDMNKVKKYSS